MLSQNEPLQRTINDISADGKALIGVGWAPDGLWSRFHAELP
ncbi:MAG TPA: hypothetical protein VFZ53_28385 [Polyangiaceae bacterium]